MSINRSMDSGEVWEQREKEEKNQRQIQELGVCGWSFQVAMELNDINSCEVHKTMPSQIKCSMNVTFVIFIQSISILKIE